MPEYSMDGKKSITHFTEDNNLYKNVKECVLLFENGTRKFFSSAGTERQITVNVQVRQKKNYSFKEKVLLDYNDASDLPTLAKQCGYGSLKTFTRHFKKHFNTTPKQWLLEMKKERLVVMLRNSDLPLKAIADKLHFSSVSHLCSFCQKKMEQTPEEIRKNTL